MCMMMNSNLEYPLYAPENGYRAPDPTGLIIGTDRTPVSRLFFSEANMEALQQGVRYGTYKQSGGQYVIGRQSRDELLTIMRSIFLTDSENVPHNVIDQVRSLNASVLDFCIPRIVREVSMYAKYKEDSTSALKPQPYGQWTSRAGLRSSQGGL